MYVWVPMHVLPEELNSLELALQIACELLAVSIGRTRVFWNSSKRS